MNYINDSQAITPIKGDESCLILADMIIDLYLDHKKKKQIEIEAQSQKDYNIEAINKSKGLF